MCYIKYLEDKLLVWWLIRGKGVSVYKACVAFVVIHEIGNGIFFPKFSDLLWDKIALVIKKNFWNSRLKAESLQKFWDH